MGLEIVGRGLPAGNNIGQRIEHLRKRKQLSKSELARSVDVARQTIIRLESQSTGRVDTLSRVFDVLGVKAKIEPKDKKKRFTENAANTSTSDEWYTPPHVLDVLYSVYSVFDLDPCSPTRDEGKAPVKAKKYFTQKNDGLSLPWCGVVFMNPPYSDVASWTKKAADSVERGDAKTVVGLVPARTDTKWWNNNCAGKADILFLHGRLKFGSQTNSAPFPSALIFWNADLVQIQETQKAIPSFHMPKMAISAE
ncbi:DNA-binding helix-turn-helix protein (fragment) [Candidatus Terasakiella magnetica]|uniref:DNA-binding helix-turn-helix protein n=2 Tax=Candidatus Terasakiella magnetica TaxID=1867952 RepID=A0A1C3RF91_9PROT